VKQIRESIRGLPEWLLRDYLQKMGARPDAVDGSAARMAADDWRVSWTTRKAPVAGASLSLTEFAMLFEGEDAACTAAFELFMQKAQRGGG